MALRVDPSSATGKAPAELLLGRPLVYPIELKDMKLKKGGNVESSFFFLPQKGTKISLFCCFLTNKRVAFFFLYVFWTFQSQF
jgi:hypothetical protein|tara:strand:- start:38 stop:286 length:249 start_codon:yes stop_codon:yes gene_type:complete